MSMALTHFVLFTLTFVCLRGFSFFKLKRLEKKEKKTSFKPSKCCRMSHYFIPSLFYFDVCRSFASPRSLPPRVRAHSMCSFWKLSKWKWQQQSNNTNSDNDNELQQQFPNIIYKLKVWNKRVWLTQRKHSTLQHTAAHYYLDICILCIRMHRDVAHCTLVKANRTPSFFPLSFCPVYILPSFDFYSDIYYSDWVSAYMHIPIQ